MTGYLGMDARTGRSLSGLDHLRQSVGDIVTTPLATLITLREYGSHGLDLIDQPGTAALRLRLIAAATMALLRWEPRARPQRIEIQPGSRPSAWRMDIVMTVVDGPSAGQTVRIDVPWGGRA